MTLDPPDDYIGHGTAVAGIAGAQTNNSDGIAGVSGEWDANIGSRLMILHIRDIPTTWRVAEALEFTADSGSTGANISLGWPEGHEGLAAMEASVNYAHGEGLTIVAAAGNNGGRIAKTNQYVIPPGLQIQ